ncbi:hypothetical protein C8P68_102892 [Mucilaginibacter yixingensis]|uniref:Uncharacterized protein n=1 Tax=Mucilaginibacter yixingensis TaxID=1295612 RepID=A0A2T5JE67_9SPHI|nr:hypothetical protein [Mucilaginibacter yixingensis]PTR00061.1 hypothetical protein C8P68_102892 [Mucilaginibacter yixingensis]
MRKLALIFALGLAVTATCFADGTKPKTAKPAAKCTDKSCCKKPGTAALMKAKKKV